MHRKLRNTLLNACVAATFAFPGGAHAGFEDGLSAFERGDYATAVEEWRAAAERGDAKAQTYIGIMYAQGQGLKQDYKEATKWLLAAAEQEFATAQSSLAKMYFDGLGLPQDYKEAARWYRRAVSQGDAYAQTELGLMYALGQGTPQDYKEALKLMGLAASQGAPLAQNNLGGMYEVGRGVPIERVVAYALYNVSAANDPSDHNKALKNRTRIAATMSPQELAAGQELSRAINIPGNLLSAIEQYMVNTQERAK